MSTAETAIRVGTQADIARIYKVSIITVKRWSREGIIVPVVRLGNVVRYDLDEVARRLRAHASRPRKPAPTNPTDSEQPK